MAGNVLIVDDSAIMRQMIRRTIQMAGLSVDQFFEAGNGIEAFSELARHRVDVVVLDINMPVMNGVQFLKRIHDDPRLREIAVVIASTEGSSTRIEELMACGARGYLRKPFQPERLRDVLQPLLGQCAEDAAPAGSTDDAF